MSHVLDDVGCELTKGYWNRRGELEAVNIFTRIRVNVVDDVRSVSFCKSTGLKLEVTKAYLSGFE
jgi:hypothetical protein